MKSDNNLKKIETFKVPVLKDRVRLSDFAPDIFKTISLKMGIKKAIKKGYVFINGTIGYTSDYIVRGEIIELFQPLIIKSKPTINLPIQVVYEDDYLAIVNKPPGILVSGNKKITLENALSTILLTSTQPDALARPEPIHRLDYPTSGALLIGKTSKATSSLNKMFEERKIKKSYHAITIGAIKYTGTIDLPIDEKPSKSEFKTIKRLSSRKYESLNLVELIPHTGRTHQLRIHMASIENPILGDLKYGKEGLLGKGNGLYLQASYLRFIHLINIQFIMVILLKLVIFAPVYQNKVAIIYFNLWRKSCMFS